MKRTRHVIAALALLSGFSVAIGFAAERENYSPYVNRDFPEQVYWGDTHVHTHLSGDAYSFGARLTPETAYRFARGETVISNSGQEARLSRPLDFVLVADHAEFLGVFAGLEAEDPLVLESVIGRRWGDMFDRDEDEEVVAEVFQAMLKKIDLKSDPEVTSMVWKSVTANADRFNESGRFTAFIGYEWTFNPDGNNLHRNVIFRDSAERANQIVPLSSLNSSDPRDLWIFLDRYEAETGGSVLAIPHNGNASGGLMFDDRTYGGEPLGEEEALVRRRWEPLYEVTQIKGDAETHPLLSPDDRFADYETWEGFKLDPNAPPKQKETLSGEYARSALQKGLQLERSLGINPFKFGLIGSSDAHTGLAAVEENNYFGKFAYNEPSSGRANRTEGSIPGRDFVASGYAAVWAHENTRKSLFDAMQRRETYATTGPRIMLRFFGGWEFDNLDYARPDYAAIGYEKGVPMGGDLAGAPEGRAPRFLIVAAKDPEGANLERVQVVKGWLDSEGETREKVFDVVLSDDRVPGDTMALPIGFTVDIQTATYTNTTGEPQMASVWQDPEFNPQERAFYYVRVLEVPTPRWTTYDAAFYGTDLPEGVPAIHQERAYSSPIWYTP